MNIQTERLENHTARFTVELDTDRLEQAKQAAAKKIAKRVNIPGFRKGKVPYKILLKYVGEGALLDEIDETEAGECADAEFEEVSAGNSFTISLWSIHRDLDPSMVQNELR